MQSTSTPEGRRPESPAPGKLPDWLHWRSWTVLAGLLLLAALAISGWHQGRDVEVVPYSVFEQYMRDGRLAEVQVGDTLITGRLREARDGKTEVAAALVEPAMAEHLARYGVSYSRVRDPGWIGSILSWLGPPLVFFALWSWMSRRMGGAAGGLTGGGLLGMGRSQARIYAQKQTGVKFADVAGVDEAKAELQEIVDFLRNPKEHGRLGARMPKGVLLMGPTGTGKTLLARAVAGEAGVPFYSISGSEFIEMFVGVGAARVRDLFEQARANAPSIIFIDELDALGKARGASTLIGGHDEREQTLNQLLVELDGFDPSVGVVLLAATNRPEVLDPALLRAGRFDRQVLVDKPDRRGRLAILQVHAKKIRLAPELDLDAIAAITVGFAGADLANVINEAALVATRRQADSVTLSDFTQAIERIVAGIEKQHTLINPQERQTVAYHEMGHVLAALAAPGAERVHKVSIIPRGVGALGYTLQRPTEDRRLMRRSELQARIRTLLAGRAAEQLVFGEVSTGAADDIARATDLARDMVMRYGMDDALGPVAYADSRPRFLTPAEGWAGTAPTAFSPTTAQAIDAAVAAVLEHAHGEATALLTRNRDLLHRCAVALLAQESLDEKSLAALTADLQR